MALTMKELKAISNKRLIVLLINERLNKLTNPYAPMSVRLRELKGWVEQHVRG